VTWVRWLQLVLILLVGGSASRSHSVVSHCRFHFTKEMWVYVNTAEISEFIFLCPFCTIISTIASLLPIGNFFLATSHKLFKQKRCSGRKKLVLENYRYLGYFKSLFKRGYLYKNDGKHCCRLNSIDWLIDWLMNDEWKRIWNETFVTWSQYYTGMYLEGLRKTVENISQCSRCLGRDSNRTSPNRNIERYLQTDLFHVLLVLSFDTMLPELLTASLK
jgi:hypothetical protein